MLSYDSIHEEYLIVDQYDEIHRCKAGDLRLLSKRVKKLHGMNATVYHTRRGDFKGMFRAEIYNNEIVDTESFQQRVSLINLRGTPAYHAYIVMYIYPTSTLEIVLDDNRHP